jgi:hypothetical protein
VASIVEAASSCLRDYGYKCEALEGELRFESHTEQGRVLRSQIVIHEEERLARLYVYLDLSYSPARRPWVCELVCRLNDSLVAGNFDFRWDSGDVHFRHSLDFRGCEATPEAVEGLLGLSAYPLRLWEHAFKHVSKRKVPAQAAVEAARIAAATSELKNVSKPTRRALLELI